MPLSDLWRGRAVDAGGNAAEPGSDSSDESHRNQNEAAAAAASLEELKRLKRRQRTAPARLQSLLSRQKKRLLRIATANLPPPLDEPEQFQATYFRSSRLWTLDDVTSGEKETWGERKQAVWLYLVSMVSAVRALFESGRSQTADGPQTGFSHVISVNINDDTDIKFASGSAGSSEVRSVMNNIQYHICARRRSDGSRTVPGQHKWFHLHQPLVVLNRALAGHIFREFMSWSLHFCKSTGQRLKALGVPDDIFAGVRTQVFVFAGDANKVNTAIFSCITKAVHYHEEEEGGDPRTIAFLLRCTIHQVCLTRKVLALGVDGYWSSLVRLGHLFESHTFRQRFYTAMAQLIRENFDFFEVASLPPGTVAWKQDSIRKLRLFSDSGSQSSPSPMSKRLKRLMKVLEKDNGDTSQRRFAHFCLGRNCCSGGREEGLGAMIHSYTNLFDYMQVPLLYRWKHAADANSFICDGFVLHSVLPRTLDLLPSVKCPMACPRVCSS